MNNIELSRIDSSDAQDDESIEESEEEESNEKTSKTNNNKKVTADKNQVDFYASKIRKNNNINDNNIKKKPGANSSKNKIFDQKDMPSA